MLSLWNPIQFVNLILFTYFFLFFEASTKPIFRVSEQASAYTHILRCWVGILHTHRARSERPAALSCQSVEQGLNVLERVLDRIRYAGLELKPSKRALFSDSGETSIGFVVESGKLHYENPNRLENVPFPENLLRLRSFLGAVNFSRAFYRHFFAVVVLLMHG